MPLRPGELLINDSTRGELLYHPWVNGRRMFHGLVERDYTKYPAEMFAPPSDMPLIPRSEWPDRIKELEAQKAQLSDVRGGMPSLDQGNAGYCWAHSTVHCVMMTRLRDNMPYVPLSAYAVAATIMSGRDEGGWCGLSAKFLREKGVPSQAIWPQGDRTGWKSHDRPETWENAALHRVEEDWVDLTRQVYDQNLTFDQVASCLLVGIPCAVDFNWWGHSVCALDLVLVEKGSYGIRILNSWSDAWGDRGTSVLQGRKAIPDGAVAIRTSRASAA